MNERIDEDEKFPFSKVDLQLALEHFTKVVIESYEDEIPKGTTMSPLDFIGATADMLSDMVEPPDANAAKALLHQAVESYLDGPGDDDLEAARMPRTAITKDGPDLVLSIGEARFVIEVSPAHGPELVEA